MLRLDRWESQLGLLRLLPRQLYMPNENLSDSDRRLYQEIAYRQLLSQAMLNESLCAKENDKKVNSPIYGDCLLHASLKPILDFKVLWYNKEIRR